MPSPRPRWVCDGCGTEYDGRLEASRCEKRHAAAKEWPDGDWPKVKCPGCGNRRFFNFHVVADVCVADGSFEGALPRLVELPFNSRVQCLSCHKWGRWNAWQQGANEVSDEEVAERAGEDPA